MPEKKEETVNVYQAVNAVMKSVGAVAKDQKNQAQKFNFRGVDQVVNAVASAIRTNGIIIAPIGTTPEFREIVSGGGKKQAWVTGTVSYGVYGPSGDRMPEPIVVAAEATDFADKATAKFMSVAYRIALLQLLNLPTDDPDPDSDYQERGTASKPAVKAATKEPASKPATVNPAARLVGDVLSACKSRNINPDQLKAKWAAVGGTGKITESTDETKLAALLTDVTMNEGE